MCNTPDATGVDLYNQTTTGRVAKTLSNRATDADHVPCVIVYGVTTKGNGEAILTKERHTSLSVGGGQAGQGYPCVLIKKKQFTR